MMMTPFKFNVVSRVLVLHHLLLLSLLAIFLEPSWAQNSIQDYLNGHNSARSQVGVGNIVWNATLAAYAQNYVNSRKVDCLLVHSNGAYGENLAKGNNGFSGSAAVNLWVAEKPFYNYIDNTCVGGQCLHYTQVVWTSSYRVGCGRVQCNNGWWIVSCNYDPPGNWEGERPY